jgi:hypothetical protein
MQEYLHGSVLALIRGTSCIRKSSMLLTLGTPPGDETMIFTRWHLIGLLLFAPLLISNRDASPADMTLNTADALGVTISENGALEDLSIGGEHLLPSGVQDFHPFTIYDVTDGEKFVPAAGKAVQQADGVVVEEGQLDGLSLSSTMRYEAADHVIKITLGVRDTSGSDRGLLVRFALPVRAEGWHWWDDMETKREIGTSGTYENSRRMREFAALPEWRDKPALSMGAHSVNFCSVITGSTGLCYAVPLDEPRIFRTGYDANKRLFYIVYDAALARDTKPPSTAKFNFYLYPCDPDWAVRSALDRYYRLFPQFFAKHVEQEGMWMAFSRLSKVDNVNEFRFAFQEGAPEPGYDDRMNVYSLTYFTHAGMFANIPDFNPETDPEPSYQTQLAAMREKFKRSTGRAEIYDASGLYDAQERLSIKRTAVYGHIIAQYNLDPQLPYGQYMLEKIPGVFRSYRQQRGGELDGFYYDGITTGVNYRREHFQYADHPPIWDPVNEKPVLYNYFSSVDFAKEAAERLHAQGKITMMNGAMGSSFYTAPYLDVMGAETGLRINRANFNYVRTICRHKPFVTLLKGNFSQLTKEDIELFMKRCVAYGVFPGFFDWPPSGLGPGSRYWDHAEWYERDRLNHRKYQALCQQLAEAGWEPLTLARSRDPELTLERFGRRENGQVFITVLSDMPHPADTVISIPADAIPDDPVVVDEVDLQWLAAAGIKEGRLEVPLRIGPESLSVLHIASKRQLAESHAVMILGNLALRKKMRELEKDRPEYLVHWPAVGNGGYERDNVAGRSCLKLTGQSDSQIKGVTQWVMLYQDEPRPLKLRLQLKCDKVEPGGQGQLHVDALLCHVNMKTRFTERKREQFNLDHGTYDWRQKEIIIQPERPLRSIQLSLNLGKCSGAVWIDEISITPVTDPTREYVVDPRMEQWYERPMAEQLKQADSMFAELEAELKSLTEGAQTPKPPSPRRGGVGGGGNRTSTNTLTHICLSALSKASAHKKWIQDNRLDNPCRRELRELNDLTARLALIGSTLMGVRGPYVDAPSVVVPGEEITVGVRVEGTGNADVHYTMSPSEGWPCQSAGDGNFAIAVPADSLGTTGQIVATATIQTASGSTLRLEESAQIRVVPAIEAAMRLCDVSAPGDKFHLAIDVSNNGQSSTEVSLRTQLPEGWRQVPSSEAWKIDAKSKRSLALCAIPSPHARPGKYELRAALSCPKLSKPLEFSHVVSFLPGSLNLLKNPGFEAAEPTNWARSDRGYEIDTSQSHGGRQSLKLHNESRDQRSSASQTIVLNQKTPRPIFVRCHVKAKNVSGHPSPSFSVYVDIYYTDGTPLYGQTIDWQTGTTDWQYGEMTIEPAKPIRNVNVYLLLRGQSGTAWFDDVLVAEKPLQRQTSSGIR